ncbi:hypothetical protein F5148DRAFT_140680 [Russula earlei]|uniref:Uncharacterized protein n=1 Tax=Russula earlei TaxID=71964 RepID=A0ACC0U6D1_9AGAM|nr:hypothetical protein F5148DRAFT_140680 [Russula earlei]
MASKSWRARAWYCWIRGSWHGQTPAESKRLVEIPVRFPAHVVISKFTPSNPIRAASQPASQFGRNDASSDSTMNRLLVALAEQRRDLHPTRTRQGGVVIVSRLGYGPTRLCSALLARVSSTGAKPAHPTSQQSKRVDRIPRAMPRPARALAIASFRPRAAKTGRPKTFARRWLVIFESSISFRFDLVSLSIKKSDRAAHVRRRRRQQ